MCKQASINNGISSTNFSCHHNCIIIIRNSGNEGCVTSEEVTKNRCLAKKKKKEKEKKNRVFFIYFSSIRVCFIVERSTIALSISLTNYSIHMDQQDQIQQQLKATNSNLIKSSQLNSIHSNSTSTLILDEEPHCGQMDLPASLSTNPDTPLRSVLKISGLFNKDWESSDKLNELFANDNEFTLHRLLSDISGNDLNIDMNEIVKFDPIKLLDTRSLSDFLQCDSSDQMHESNDIQSIHVDNVPPSAIACSSGSFSECYPPTPEPPIKEMFTTEAQQLKIEPDTTLMYTQLDSFDNFVLTPSTSTPHPAQEFNFDPDALAAFEHDYGFLSKRTTTIIDTPSPSPTIPKRTPIRQSRRLQSRLQSRATLNDVNHDLNDDIHSSTNISENSSITFKRTKNSRHVNRAVDIKTEDDLSYYLERRRKNNEASKMSRAARKQKFGDMHLRCAEYERVNVELRFKISTLEIITSNLKNGLIHNFQRKDGVDAKF